jgi:VanZ family protein
MAWPRIAARLTQLAFWGAAILTFVLAVAPESKTPPLIPWDKAAHFIAFYVLAILAAAGFPRRALLWLALGLSAYGALIELVQGLPMVNRDSSFWDWVADSVAIAAALLPLLLPRWRAWLRNR